MNNNHLSNNLSYNSTNNNSNPQNQELEETSEENFWNSFVISRETPLLTREQYYSQQAREEGPWDYSARQRYNFEELERRNIRELSSGEDHFLGIEVDHLVPDRYRHSAENYFPEDPIKYFSTHYPQEPIISTTVTLYPDSFPVFTFTDPSTGVQTSSAYPSARDTRLNRNTRIILQALEVSLLDPPNCYWEDFYQETE